MAFDRFKTKLKQAVGDAEKTVIDPALKEGIRQVDETTVFGDKIKDACKEALPIVASMAKMTKIENLGALIKQAAAKYGTEKPEAAGLLHAGEILANIGKEERALLQKAEGSVYTLIKETHEFNDALKKEKSKLETAALDLDGAKIKLKSGKGDQSKVDDTNQKYEAQKTLVEQMVAKLSEHRDKQRQAAKILLEAQSEFFKRCAEAIDNSIGQCGG